MCMRRISNSIFRYGGMHLSQVATKCCGCRSRDSRLVDCPQRTANEALRVRLLRLASHDRTIGGRLNGRRVLNQPVEEPASAAGFLAVEPEAVISRSESAYRFNWRYELPDLVPGSS